MVLCAIHSLGGTVLKKLEAVVAVSGWVWCLVVVMVVVVAVVLCHSLGTASTELEFLSYLTICVERISQCEGKNVKMCS